jgi:hypothetical protein
MTEEIILTTTITFMILFIALVPFIALIWMCNDFAKALKERRLK